MVTCELDSEVSGEALGLKLPAWQALLLHRVLPSCAGLLVYLTLICFDLALIYEYYSNGYSGIGTFCVVLMVTPALVSLIFTLASPPPGLQTDDSALSVSLEKQDVYWILEQIVNFFVFPITAVSRYCHQIFWSVEAVCAARSDDVTRARAALRRVRAPSPTELYLFLQAFLHAAPHALLNIFELMATAEQPSFDKISVQAVSIVASIMRMASTATVYRRFEREKVSGRRYPWSPYPENLEDNSEKTENNYESNLKYTSTVLVNNSTHDLRPSQERNTLINNLDTYTKDVNKSYSFIDNFANESASESDDYTEYKIRKPNNEDDSDDEYVRPRSIIDKVAPLRRDTLSSNIQTVYIPPPPAFEAPRPGSIAVWAEKLVENVESIPDWLSAPQRRRHYSEVDQDEDFPLPQYVPQPRIRGLEPQDASAAIVQFMAWYMFFIARLLSIAAFINYFPVVAIIVLFSHYQVILLFLIVPQASTVRRGFYIFLAFVYIFCLLEFKVRFRHVRAWHVFWFMLCTIETVLFIGLWGANRNSVSNWWNYYVSYTVLCSLLLSYMSMAFYFVLLKPRETVVYLNNKK